MNGLMMMLHLWSGQRKWNRTLMTDGENGENGENGRNQSKSLPLRLGQNNNRNMPCSFAHVTPCLDLTVTTL